MDQLEGFLRLADIIGAPHADPPRRGLLPISKSAWWAGCRSGRFPAPVKLGERTTAWRASDIRKLLADLAKVETRNENARP